MKAKQWFISRGQSAATKGLALHDAHVLYGIPASAPYWRQVYFNLGWWLVTRQSAAEVFKF